MIRAEHFMREPRISHSRGLIRSPGVSIILPTYCRGGNGLLKRAIDSVLSQSFSDFELIVMDDGSTDGTADLISAYVKADDRVIHVRHDSNCGLPALRVNEGLLMARGQFCAYQFDDDQWTNGALAMLVGALRGSPSFEIAYGRCECIIEGVRYPLGFPFNYSQLIAGNYIANNSLIHHRTLFERLGGYDMHLLMRRACDWDLWLRWGRHAAFLFVDEVVSIVEAHLPGSIGRTVDSDVFAMRAHMAADRNAGLRPDALQSYVIDDLDHLRHLGERRVDAIWRQHVALYRSQFPQIWRTVRPRRMKPLHVVVIKAEFDTTIDITITNFTEALAGGFAFTFVPQQQADREAIRTADILVLHRTINPHAEQLAEMARERGVPVIFLMDDDLTTMHELGGEFSCLAPGTPCRLSLESLIRGADLVVTYSPLMQESVQALNARRVLLETNIRERWLAKAKSRLDEAPGISAAGDRPVRIGFAGGAARREEFAALWPAIVQASRHLGAGAEFHFWGFTPDAVDQLQSPYCCEPFTYSYEQYMGRLTSSGFDVMIAPLFGVYRFKRAKCPIKFLEITAAGAVGVYSDVEPYRVVVDGVTGIKCENTVDAWLAAILRAASMLPQERKAIVKRAILAVERDYTSEGQAPRVAATLEAAVLHHRLKRTASGKPRIAYFCHSPYLGGGENHLLRHAALAQAFQFEPLLVLPSHASGLIEEVQRRAAALGMPIAYLPLTWEAEIDVSKQLDEPAIATIQRWLRQNHVSLVHSVVLMREVGEATRRLGLPHVASLYATKSCGPTGISHCDVVHSDSFLYTNRWSEILNAPARRILSFVPHQYFDIGDSADATVAPAQEGGLTVGLFGTVQPRKGQLQAVEALGLLRKRSNVNVRLRLYGYKDFCPDLVSACEQMAERYGVSDEVSFAGFVSDTAAALREVDVVLCASDWESMPQAILEAMAAGILVIAPRVGGIAEVVSPGTGVLMPDNTPASICQALVKVLGLTCDEWRDKTNLAREVVRGECSKYSVATELFRLYGQAAAEHPTQARNQVSSVLDLSMSPAGGASFVPTEVAGALEILRSRLHEINAEMRRAE
jgi:O-antigen biosynthesis protein